MENKKNISESTSYWSRRRQVLANVQSHLEDISNGLTENNQTFQASSQANNSVSLCHDLSSNRPEQQTENKNTSVESFSDI